MTKATASTIAIGPSLNFIGMELEITLYEHVFKKTSRNEGLMTYVKGGLVERSF